MVYQNIETNYEDIDGKEYPVTIWLDKPVADKESAAMSIVNTLVNEKDKEYYGLFSEYVWKYYIIKLFADGIEFSKEPTFEEIEQFVTETNLYYIVLQHVDGDITDEIQKEVERNIEFKTGVRMHTVEDILSEALTSMQQKVDSVDVDSLTTNMAKVMTELKKINGE